MPMNPFEPITDEQIKTFISQLRDDLVTAEKFHAMWRRRNQTPSLVSPHEQLPLNGATSENDNYGRITEDVRMAIAQFNSEFKVSDVESILYGMGKPLDRATIARCIHRLLQ